MPLMFLLLMALIAAAPTLRAEDWPEWRGAGRQGVWTETGIIDKFPAGGLKASWRGEVGNGYAGPAVADGLVYVTDIVNKQGARHRACALPRRKHRKAHLEARVARRLQRHVLRQRPARHTHG